MAHPNCTEGDPDWPHGCGPTCVNWNECAQVSLLLKNFLIFHFYKSLTSTSHTFFKGIVDCGLGWQYDQTIIDAHEPPVCTDTIGSAYCECPIGFYSADPAVVVGNRSDSSPPAAGLGAPAGSLGIKFYTFNSEPLTLENRQAKSAL